MNLVIRLDLQYTPWNQNRNELFGEAEAATLVRMLEHARRDGTQYHAFATNAVTQTFPALIEALLTDRHPVDLLVSDTEDFQSQWDQATKLHRKLQNLLKGAATLEHSPIPNPPAECSCISTPFACPTQPNHFPVTLPPDDQIPKEKPTDWMRRVFKVLEDAADSQHPLSVLQIHPQVLGRIDPSLTKLRQILTKANDLGFNQKTFHDLIS